MGNPHRDRRRHRGNDSFDRADDYSRYGSLDVSVGGYRDRQEPERRPQQGGRGNSDARGSRPRLEFKELICLEQGECRCRITVAPGFNGPIYNFSVERQNRDRGSRFFRETDAQDLAAVVQRAGEYIRSQKSQP